MAAVFANESELTSFGRGFSEEKIKMWKVNGRRTPKAHIAFGKVS
jgi:hypothetical protein